MFGRRRFDCVQFYKCKTGHPRNELTTANFVSPPQFYICKINPQNKAPHKGGAGMARQVSRYSIS